jgi:ubiquinone biosynthesis protein COQ4
MLISRKRRVFAGDRFLTITEGRIFETNFAAFGETPGGNALLAARPDTFALLCDRETLQCLPVGSLGRCYLDFMDSHGLNDKIYRDFAVAAGANYADDPARAWFRTRVNAMHDLRHLIAGYGPDFRGETCLLSFRFGQLRHWGAFVLSAMASFGEMIRLRRGAFAAAREAYLRGRQARLLDLVPWEQELDVSLAQQRARLGLAPPVYYPATVGAKAWPGAHTVGVSLEGSLGAA